MSVPSQDTPPESARSTDPNFGLFCALWIVWALGFGLTLFLMWSTRGKGLPPGCGVEHGCGIVLSSEYSRVFNIPLTTWAAGYFVVAGLVLFMSRFSFQISLAPPFSLMLPVVSSIGVAAGVWSLVVMGVFLQEFCYYCVALHLCNFVFSGLAIAYARQDWQRRQYRRWKANVPELPFTPITMHLVIASLLVTGQVLAMSLFHTDAPATLLGASQTGPSSALDVKAIGNILERLSVEVAPPGGTAIVTSKGPRNAPHKIVTYGCLTCPHCKKANDVFKAMMARYPGQLRVDVRFFPLWKCNDVMSNIDPGKDHQHACKLARYAWAVALADDTKFEEYVNWLYDNQKEMTPRKAIEKGKELVGADAFQKARDSEALALRERHDLDLAKNMGMTGVPQVFLAGGQVYGGMSFKSLDKLFTEQFGWTPAADADDVAPENDEIVLLSKRDVNNIAKAGQTAEQDGNFKLADEKYARVLELQPDALGVIIAHARLLSTCSDDQAFDPKRAAEVFATGKTVIERRDKAVKELPEKTTLEQRRKKENIEKMKEVWARYHEIGASVAASNGDFSNARTSMMKAIRYFQEKGDKKNTDILEKRFNNYYQRNKVYRDKRKT